MSKCSHETSGRIRVETTDYDGEPDWEYQTETKSAWVDIDLHRFKCSLCGEVGYYSGAAKEFHENGVKGHIQGLH